MEIRRLDSRTSDVSPEVTGTMVGAEGAHVAAWQVPAETPVAILVNGETFAVMMATPADLEDFAVGFALTEGIVPAASRIESLRIGEASDGYLLNLRVAERFASAAQDRKRSIAGRSGCGICGAQTIEAAVPRPPRVQGVLPAAAALAHAFEALRDAQVMNRTNHSTHAAAFCLSDGSIERVREDIGRHNALDKLIGALARDGKDTRVGFLLVSSRISVELVQKAAVAGAPFLAAVSAPSKLALDVAGRCGMGLASLAGDGIMVFEPAKGRGGSRQEKVA
ncbi:MAG: formate dehydrogenase accessory sulfurtransferase FdhD [Alphaproteobacteria bacterium]|nr:formate dehydrogenase accessory sulfurtransferase FdhD [Alphaproteobacteria bacterium]